MIMTVAVQFDEYNYVGLLIYEFFFCCFFLLKCKLIVCVTLIWWYMMCFGVCDYIIFHTRMTPDDAGLPLTFETDTQLFFLPKIVSFELVYSQIINTLLTSPSQKYHFLVPNYLTPSPLPKTRRISATLKFDF